MVENAEQLKQKYIKLNEADGPVFKIRNDPRHTKVGRFINRFALDELPQFWNVICGEMALVGPRPLPIAEAKKVPERYRERFSTLPGMTSSWIIKGGHRLTFEKWMELDMEYVRKKSLWYDTKILFSTLVLIAKIFIKKSRNG